MDAVDLTRLRSPFAPTFRPEPVPIDPATGLFLVPTGPRAKGTFAVPRGQTGPQTGGGMGTPAPAGTSTLTPQPISTGGAAVSPTGGDVSFSSRFTTSPSFGTQGISGASSGVVTDIINRGIDLGFGILEGRLRQQTATSPLPTGTLPGPTLVRQQAPSLDLQRQLIEQGMPGQRTGMRKRRSMNVTNQRALRRAMRRVEGFAKIAKRTISFTKRVKIKSRRRR